MALAPLHRQQIQRVCEGSRSRAIAIARQSATQCAHRAAVLEKQRSGHGGIAGVHVNGCPVLCGVQKDFCKRTIFEPADAERVADPAVLEVQQFMTAPVWEITSYPVESLCHARLARTYFQRTLAIQPRSLCLLGMVTA